MEEVTATRRERPRSLQRRRGTAKWPGAHEEGIQTNCKHFYSSYSEMAGSGGVRRGPKGGRERAEQGRRGRPPEAEIATARPASAGSARAGAWLGGGYKL